MKYASLIIDMQNVEAVSFIEKDWQTLTHIICGFKNECEALDIPSIHVAYLEKDPFIPPVIGTKQEVDSYLTQTRGMGLDKGREALNFPLTAHELVATKYSCSAAAPHITNFLRARDIDTVFISGVSEDPLGEPDKGYCVTQTAIDFAKEGFRAIVVSEATNVRTKSHFLGKPTEKQRMRAYRPWGVEVMPLRDIVSMMGSGSKLYALAS